MTNTVAMTNTLGRSAFPPSSCVSQPPQGRMAGDDQATKDKKRADKKREENLEVPKKSNLGDSATIKRIMDDAVVQVSVARPNGGLGVVAPTQPCEMTAGGARRVPRGPQL